MASAAVRDLKTFAPADTTPNGSAFLARYAYRAEQTAQSLGNFAGQGLVLELVPAIAMLNHTD